MKITVYINNNKIDKSHIKLFNEYIKRLPNNMKVTTKKLSDNISKKDDRYLIGICPSGKNLSSEEFSNEFYKIHDDRRVKEICFVLYPSQHIKCNQTISITSVETNDDMALVILAEVLYRAWGIKHNRSYHK